MKRFAGSALIALTIAASAASITFAQGPYGGGGPGPRGGGPGPGMMGEGFEPGMMGGGNLGNHPALAQLPADKQEQVRAVHVSMAQAMSAKSADMRSKALALGEAMRKFPIDQAEVKKLHDSMEQVRAEMFALRLNALAQTQQIVGKDVWEQLQKESPRGARKGQPGAYKGR